MLCGAEREMAEGRTGDRVNGCKRVVRWGLLTGREWRIVVCRTGEDATDHVIGTRSI